MYLRRSTVHFKNRNSFFSQKDVGKQVDLPIVNQTWIFQSFVAGGGGGCQMVCRVHPLPPRFRDGSNQIEARKSVQCPPPKACIANICSCSR